MLLLCPAALARNEKLQVRGWLHRPQEEATAPSGKALHYALQWGATSGQAIGGMIRAGFGDSTARRLRVALHAAGGPDMGASNTEFVLDTLIGDTGSTAPWLAVVLAMERAMSSAEPQLVGVESEGSVLLAVLSPEKMQQAALRNEKIPN
jgi:hypothetical protein